MCYSPKQIILVTIRKSLLQYIITDFDSKNNSFPIKHLFLGFFSLKGLFAYGLNTNMPMHPYALNSCRQDTNLYYVFAVAYRETL